MKTIENHKVDLVLTDPPYAISKKNNFSITKNDDFKNHTIDFGEWDHQEVDMKAFIEQFYKKLRMGGTCIIFYDVWKMETMKKLMEEAGFKQIRLIEWLKKNPKPRNSKTNYLSNAREYAILGVKGTLNTFNSSYDRGVYVFSKVNGNTHPTQKPVALFRALIEKHSKKGDVVLDTFVGSGTTIKACKESGRRCLATDITSLYLEENVLPYDDAILF